MWNITRRNIMANTTFSGPVKAGTISNTTGTTLGTNIANVGQVLMAQSVIVDIIGASHLNQVCAVVPANSQIVDVIVNVTTVNNDTGAATVTVLYMQNNSIQDAVDL